jgi:hypothetical protein
MVSILIGKGGCNIKQLQSKTHTTIYIEAYRTGDNIWNNAQVTGEIKNIAEVTKLLYEIIESKFSFIISNAQTIAAVIMRVRE